MNREGMYLVVRTKYISCGFYFSITILKCHKIKRMDVLYYILGAIQITYLVIN